MRFIDSHTHTYLRGPEDLELMAISGVEGVIVCSFLPFNPSGFSTMHDLFKWLIEVETYRLSQYGISARIAIGIHPKSIPESDVKSILDYILTLFDNEKASALGEVGLEIGSKEEEEILIQQIRIANEYPVPMIIHTPRNNKSKILDKLLSIIDSENVDPARVIIDHLTPDLVEKVRSIGAIAGLTVQPGKLTPRDIYDIITKFGTEGIVVNSDIGINPSDPLALPRTAHYLDRCGVSGGDIQKILYSNIRILLPL
ncbi:MAG: TatD family hydrolase [Candidatus Methanomethyliaceae archaeon]|nr:TatD family hydrolase [Candidatus Methanomethyliaceae archaeon]MDW7971240.1 TatD family hydrolase [Nitrososphaerota archaeon]